MFQQCCNVLSYAVYYAVQAFLNNWTLLEDVSISLFSSGCDDDVVIAAKLCLVIHCPYSGRGGAANTSQNHLNGVQSVLSREVRVKQ